jgi:hypothetical protein
VNNFATRRSAGLALACLCVGLTACGGSEVDAVELYQLQFNPWTGGNEIRLLGEGSPVCVPTYVGFFIERKDGGALPDDLAVTRVTLSRPDGSQAWSPQLDPQRAGFLDPGRLLWRGVAEGCSYNRLTGERFNVFPGNSFATLTVQLSAGGLRGQLQQHDVYISPL